MSFGCGQFASPHFAHPTTYQGAAIAAGQTRVGCRAYTTLTLNGGPAWHYLIGEAGRLMETIDPQLHTTLVESAPDGRPLWSEDGNGQPTDYTYDGQTGQLLTVQAPDPDGAGPLGRPVTSYRYDESKIGTATTPGTQQTGLRAEWYANQTLSGIAKTTTWSHTSGGILDEIWTTTGPPALGSPTSNWSVRFSGTLNAPATGDYHFQLSIDDGANVLIDDRPVVSDWNPGTLRTVNGAAAYLTAGSHRIVVEYFQGTGPSELHLSWEKPGDTSYSLVPATQVAPGYGLQTSTVSPMGEVSFSHYADPESGEPDYTQTGGSLRLVSSYTYDALGRILTRVQPKGNSARTIGSDGTLGGTPNTLYQTSYAYYADTATAAPPAGCPTGGAVNQAGQLQTISRTGYATQTSVYDVAGRVIASTNGKGTTCSTYDAEGRLVSQRVPGDATITGCPSDASATACFSYDPAGLVRTSRTASGEVDLAYGEDGQVIRSTQKNATGSTFGEATIDYTAFGDPANTIIAAGPLASATNYHYSSGYNSTHQLTSQKIIDGAGGQQEEGDFQYDPAGHLGEIQNLDISGGANTFLTYDNDGNITNVYNRHGAGCNLPCSVPTDLHPFADFTYVHDADGRITGQTRTGDALTTQTTGYTYDAASRLATATLPSGLVRTYHYDDDSNRTSIDEKPAGGSLTTVATYAYSSAAQDRLSTVTTSGATTYGYNTDGDTTSYGTNTLTWNGHGTIASDNPTATSTVNYTYDPLGRLQQRTTTGPAKTNAYIYVGTADTATMVTDGAGTITESYITSPLGTRRLNNGPPLGAGGTPPAGSTFIMADGLGNNAVNLDSSATRTATYTYDPFGTPNDSAPANTLTNRYLTQNGRPLDTATGLVLMGVRPYDSTTGRFLSVDPLEGGSANLYDYANQDPLNQEDPTGTATGIGIKISPLHLGAALAFLFAVLVNNGGGGGAGLPCIDCGSNTDAAPPRIVFSTNPPWSDLKPFRGSIRTNGQTGNKRRYYERDRLHDNEVEVYDGQGEHLGAMDQRTGAMIKPRNPRYSIKDRIK